MGLFSDWRAFHRASRAHGGGLRILKEAARDLASLKEPMEGVALPEGAVEVVAPEGAVSTEDVDRDFETECWGALDVLAEAGGGTVLDMGTGGRLTSLLERFTTVRALASTSSPPRAGDPMLRWPASTWSLWACTWRSTIRSAAPCCRFPTTARA